MLVFNTTLSLLCWIGLLFVLKKSKIVKIRTVKVIVITIMIVIICNLGKGLLNKKFKLLSTLNYILHQLRDRDMSLFRQWAFIVKDALDKSFLVAKFFCALHVTNTYVCSTALVHLSLHLVLSFRLTLVKVKTAKLLNFQLFGFLTSFFFLFAWIST